MTMRLSDAIRLGALLKPQAFEGPGKERLKDEARTCALAAAAEAVGEETLDVNKGIWLGEWKWMLKRVQCPACEDLEQLGDVIVRLNDAHRWTREAIADWVEGLEAARKPVAAVPLLEVLA